MKLVGYVRVSTSKQGDNGISLECQTSKLESYASTYDHQLMKVIIVDESAKTLERKGLQEALAMIDSGEIDGLLVFKLDRLTRNVVHLGLLLEKYFTTNALVSVSDQIDTKTPAGRLVLNVLMSVAQWQREEISCLTSSNMQFKAEQGFHMGRAGYGFQAVDGKLVEVATEQNVIARMRHLRNAGNSFQAIADTLQADGITNRNGKAFSGSSINVILK